MREIRDFLINEELDKFLKNNHVLETSLLLKHYYLLSNDNLTILIDSVKPRIEQIMFHGKLGTFSNLLYHVEWDRNFWGVYPVLYHKNRNVWVRYTPLNYLQTQANPPGQIIFKKKENIVIFKDITCFADDNSGNSITGVSMEIGLRENQINIHIDYPDDVWGMGICMNIYPLYRYIIDEEQDNLLTNLDYSYNTDVIVGSKIRLVDIQGRLPILRIDAGKQRCHVKAESIEESGYAYLLTVETEGRVRENDIKLELLSNPVVIKVNPMVNADKEEKIVIYSESKPKLQIDGKDIRVRKQREGTYEAKYNFKEGRHKIIAEVNGHKSVREIYGIGDISTKIVRIADILLELQYKEGPLKDFFAWMYYCDTLKPFRIWFGESVGACLSYGHRVCASLVTATLVTGKKKYADALYRFIKAVDRVSHHYEDGSIVMPVDLGLDGRVIRKMYFPENQNRLFTPDALNDALRPMNQFEMARACLMAYKAFKYLGEKTKAMECLDYAYRYAATLLKMQREDGSIAKRYMFYSLEETSKEGVIFPLPIGSQLIPLIEAMESEKMDKRKIDNIKLFLSKQVEYFDRLPSEALNILTGGEARINDFAQMVSLCESYIIKYYVGKDKEKARRKAEEAFKIALLKGANFIDKPDFYFAEIVLDISTFLCEPVGIKAPGKGSMSDFQSVCMGLAMKKFFNSKLGDLAIGYGIGNRIAQMVLESGALSCALIDIPGFYYRRENNTQSDCDQTALGCAGYYLITGEAIW